MPEPFSDRLIQAVSSKRSCLVVGIDPRLEWLPRALLARFPDAHRDFPAAAECYRQFASRIIERVAPFVPAIKPQIAFFERLGPPGLAAYEAVVRFARQNGLLVIGDVKRNDIDSTAQAYAEAYLGPVQEGSLGPAIELDAVTLNPYLGSDSIRPFLDSATARGKGLFILVRTSNRSAREFQDFGFEARRLYEEVAARVAEWGQAMLGRSGYSSVGAVVGATYPGEAARLRRLMPFTPFLVPGYGSQGASADDVAPCFNPDGLGAVVNAARAVIFAYRQSPEKELYGEERWEEAVEAAARRLSRDLARFLPR
ncbi:MAG: orotidine-5'-phosphate decarboxylase [Planctomycetes bacterium]|nr:orotidine-5'-phosphate decarboxylase [Planctomycetota bacterium]